MMEYPLTIANRLFYLIAGMNTIWSTAAGCLGSSFILEQDFIFSIYTYPDVSPINIE